MERFLKRLKIEFSCSHLMSSLVISPSSNYIINSYFSDFQQHFQNTKIYYKIKWQRTLIRLYFWWKKAILGCSGSHVRFFAKSVMSSCSCSFESDSLWLDRLSMEFFRQEYWSGLPFPPPGDLPTQGSNSSPPDWQVDCLWLSYLGSPNILLIGLLIY